MSGQASLSSSAIDAVIAMCTVGKLSGLAVPLERSVGFCGISAVKAAASEAPFHGPAV